MKVLILFLFITNLHAFTLSNSSESKFSNPIVTVDVSITACDNSSATPEALLDMAMDSAELYWNSIPTCQLELRRGRILNVDISNLTGALASDFDNATDNHILVGCNKNTTLIPSAIDSTVLALASHFNNRGLVFINDTPNTPFDTISSSQKNATLAHEIGHAVGIGHTDIEYSLMYYSIGLVQEKLSYDDMDACHYLYNRETIVNCSSISNVSNKTNNSIYIFVVSFLLCIILGKFYTTKLG